MGVVTAGDFMFTQMRVPVPPCCNGCSRAFNHRHHEQFVYWSFQGPEMLDAAPHPITGEQAIGCEEGPLIALCFDCALWVGRNLIEDGALLRWSQGQYPCQLREAAEAEALFAEERAPWEAA